MPSTLRRLATALTATGAVLALALTAAPAHAVDVEPPQNEQEAISGRSLNLSWLEAGRLPGGVLGNYHFGYLGIELPDDGSETFIYGDVIDLECPPGVTPDDGWGGGHDGEEPEGPFCEEVALRTMEGGDLTVVSDRRNRNARITGTLAVTDHGTPLGNPVVDIRLSGGSDTFVERWSSRYTQGSAVYSSTYSLSGRNATVTGRIGPMVFDDAEGEYSSASIASWTQVSRTRVR